MCKLWPLSSSFGRCALVTTYVTQPICTHHNWCLKALIDVILQWMKCVGHELCCPTDAYTPQVKLARLGSCWCHWKTLFPTCAHATSDACKNNRWRLADVHTLCLMHACLGRCILTLAAVIFHIYTCYTQCVQAMNDVFYVCGCMQAMYDVAVLMCTHHVWCVHTMDDVSWFL